MDVFIFSCLTLTVFLGQYCDNIHNVMMSHSNTAGADFEENLPVIMKSLLVCVSVYLSFNMTCTLLHTIGPICICHFPTATLLLT